MPLLHTPVERMNNITPGGKNERLKKRFIVVRVYGRRRPRETRPLFKFPGMAVEWDIENEMPPLMPSSAHCNGGVRVLSHGSALIEPWMPDDAKTVLATRSTLLDDYFSAPGNFKCHGKDALKRAA